VIYYYKSAAATEPPTDLKLTASVYNSAAPSATTH
jgi:hypothetical protein